MTVGKHTVENIKLIVAENAALIEHLAPSVLDEAASLINHSHRLFFFGLGRSGLAFKMAAMRFMHLGYNVYVVGEIVTPAISDGDLLIVASGSGTTTSVIHAVEKAKKAGASVLGFTTDPESVLAKQATQTVIVPAASKTDFSESISQQYAGSLFEQFALLLLDGLFMSLWQKSGKSKESLWPRHANLE